MKTSKKPTLQDYDNGVVSQPEKIFLGLPELADMIEDRWAIIPSKDNKKAFYLWKKEMMSLINEYNARAGFKAYKHV